MTLLRGACEGRDAAVVCGPLERDRGDCNGWLTATIATRGVRHRGLIREEFDGECPGLTAVMENQTRDEPFVDTVLIELIGVGQVQKL